MALMLNCTGIYFDCLICLLVQFISSMPTLSSFGMDIVWAFYRVSTSLKSSSLVLLSAPNLKYLTFGIMVSCPYCFCLGLLWVVFLYFGRARNLMIEKSVKFVNMLQEILSGFLRYEFFFFCIIWSLIIEDGLNKSLLWGICWEQESRVVEKSRVVEESWVISCFRHSFLLLVVDLHCNGLGSLYLSWSKLHSVIY